MNPRTSSGRGGGRRVRSGRVAPTIVVFSSWGWRGRGGIPIIVIDFGWGRIRLGPSGIRSWGSYHGIGCSPVIWSSVVPETRRTSTYRQYWYVTRELGSSLLGYQRDIWHGGEHTVAPARSSGFTPITSSTSATTASAIFEGSEVISRFLALSRLHISLPASAETLSLLDDLFHYSYGTDHGNYRVPLASHTLGTTNQSWSPYAECRMTDSVSALATIMAFTSEGTWDCGFGTFTRLS